MISPEGMDEDKKLHRLLSDLNFHAVIKNLKEAEINVDFRDITHGLQTLLMRLCHVPVDDAKRREILYLILARSPTVNIQDCSGRTALMHACIAEKLDIIQALSSIEECDPNVTDEDINSALTYAVRSRKPSVVETLLVAFKNRGLDVNHKNNKGQTALEEGVAQLDSNISKLLVRLGGADASVLKQEMLSPSRTRRSVNAVLHGPVPRSPLSRRRQDHPERPESLCSLSVPNGSLHRPGSPSGTGDMLTVNSPSSRGSSRASSLDDLQEDENEDEEEKEYMQYHSNLNQHRRNSLSLPDLRNMPNSFVGNCSPVVLPASSLEHLSLHKSSSRCGSPTLKLPQLTEEEIDDELGEQILSFNPAGSPFVSNYKRQRRNSVSLPNLRDSLQDNVDDNSNTQAETYIFGDYSDDNLHRQSRAPIAHRRQQFNKMCYSQDILEKSIHTYRSKENSSQTRKRSKQLLNLHFRV